MAANVQHTTIRNQKLFCHNCGGEYQLQYPISIPDMNKKIASFNTLHADCPKTWTEQQADQSKSIHEKAMHWIACGEHGMSSKTMWNCLMGNKKYDVSHPYDPDDFKRCYKLLQTVPEWKSQLHRLKPLSRQWSNLVDNWDKLTEMFEKNIAENWVNKKEVGMFDFMQKLIK